MAVCDDKNTLRRGQNNPIQAKIVENDHGGSTPSGDNTILGLSCDASVYVGAVVRISGATVINALADGATGSNIMGVCISKTGATTCDVQVTGYTSDILSGLIPGIRYFLSDTVPGALTTTLPTAAGHVVLGVGIARSALSLIIEPAVQLVRS